MKAVAIFIAAIAVAVAATLYIQWPVGHIPTYDAKLVRLAETPEQGFCAGIVFWATVGEGSKWQAKDCRAKLDKFPKKYPHYVSLRIAQTFFCRGITKAGFTGGVANCVSILDSYTYWPTYNGGLTANWSQKRPYPKKSGPSIG